MPVLLLFPESYPYSAALEETFIEPELPHLRAAFDRVLIVPSHRGGRRASPADVEVLEDLAQRLEARGTRRRLIAEGLRASLTWSDIRQRPSLLASPAAMKRLVWSAARARLVKEWLVEFLGRSGIRPEEAVAYTFWADAVTLGLCLAKGVLPGLVVVTRAHGVDLYAERHRPAYLPCRRYLMSSVDGIYPDSDRGVTYLRERYPAAGARSAVARMGVPDPGFVGAPSEPGEFVVASCSRIVPVKRVDLIGKAVAAAARQRPTIRFEWWHHGDGEERAELLAVARTTFPPNAEAHLPGFQSVAGLMAFYRDHPVDVFVNASTSEGTPVALMEAASTGLPIVATDVGGNPEVARTESGICVSANPTVEELAEAILAIADDRSRAVGMRQASRIVWRTSYDADANYASFASTLLQVRSGA